MSKVTPMRTRDPLQHPRMRFLAAALDPGGLSEKWASVQTRGLQQAVYELLESDDIAISLAVDGGYLLDDIAVAHMHLGSCDVRIVVANVTEPGGPQQEHAVVIFVGATKVSLEVVMDANREQASSIILASQVKAIDSLEKLEQHLICLAYEMRQMASDYAKKADECMRHADRLDNLLKA